MSTAVLVEERLKDAPFFTSKIGTEKSTALGWFVLLILGTAAISHVAIAVIIGLVNRAVGH